jgi:stearoyl-CoA desaturase (delta-9 desaturase)
MNGHAASLALLQKAANGGSRNVCWWAGHHRHHHKYSDMPEDVHSPKQGFWWSHVGWILCMKFHHTPYDQIKDFAKYPELRWLNRYHLVPPTLLGLSVWYFGGWPALFGGFFLSTVLLYHGTFSINSLTHMWGKRRYKTTDDSRNSLILALITMGEGWHNNHHYYQSTANQGFYWWEIDLSYYILKMMSWVGLARDLRNPSEAVLNRNRLDRPEQLAPSGPSEEPPGGPSGEELAA